MINRLALRAVTLTAMTVALSGVVADGALATPSGPGPGNSANVHRCHRDGWRSLVTSSGQPFTSQAACVSHGASGGVLSPRPSASLVVELGTCIFLRVDELLGTWLRCPAMSIVGSGLMPGADLIGCNPTIGECITVENWVEADGTTQDWLASGIRAFKTTRSPTRRRPPPEPQSKLATAARCPSREASLSAAPPPEIVAWARRN